MDAKKNITRLRGKEKQKVVLKDWSKTVLEIGKWAVVLWLLWPLRNASHMSLDFTRVALGIFLFVIFSGKLFYDTIIMEILKKRRTTVKQDLVALLGMVAIITLIVGVLVTFVAFLIVEMMNMNREGQ
jgi:hypothetical protein